MLAAGIPLAVLGAFHELGSPRQSDLVPGQQQTDLRRASPSPSPSPTTPPSGMRGLLRQARHADRLPRVQGIVNGMTQKLQNLADRLNRHLINVERRIKALEAAGHVITVEQELANARTRVNGIQAQIADLLTPLETLADQEQPRTSLRAIRTGLTGIRTDLRDVRAAFQALRLAIRADVRNRPSPSPAVTPPPSPTSVVSPSPTLSPP